MKHFHMLLCLCLLALPALFACECDNSNLQQGKARIQAEPSPLQFQTLGVGSSQIQVLSISNVGTAALTIDSITLAGDPAFSLISVGAQGPAEVEYPLGLAQPNAGQSQVDCQIEFFPEELRDYSGELIISSDDGDSPELRVPLVGSGSVPDIEADPALVEFSGVAINSSGSQQLVIHNRGGAPLLIPAGGMSLASQREDSPFLFQSPEVSVEAGGQATVELIYSPKQILIDPVEQVQLPDEDVLLIQSNDPDENPVEVGLWGLPDANLPPFVGVRVESGSMLDGTPLEDPCAMAPSDTVVLGATVLDPEGGGIQPSFLTWYLPDKPDGSARMILDSDPFLPSFKPDLSGEYVACLQARDAEGETSSFDPAQACTCAEANAAEGTGCACVLLRAYPREDIRIELTWDVVGPDLDLHLLAPDGDFCSPSLDCRSNPLQPDDPDWTRTACVQLGETATCRTPSDPATSDCGGLSCEEHQECFDDVNLGAACYWQTCSGTDCFWDARNPDWGVPGDTSDDPRLAIDCTHGCRVENINMNNPEVGIYRINVNYYAPYVVDTEATVRIYFRGDLQPSYEFSTTMGDACDTWHVAQIDWIDHDNHPVTYQGDAHSSLCCQ